MRLVNLERLADNSLNAQPRVERRERVLKYHLHLAAQRAQLRTTSGEQVAALEANLACVGFNQSEQHPCQRGLPAARFADNRQGLPRRERQAHVVYSPHAAPRLHKHTGAGLKTLAQVARLDQSGCGHYFRSLFGSLIVHVPIGANSRLPHTVCARARGRRFLIAPHSMRVPARPGPGMTMNVN